MTSPSTRYIKASSKKYKGRENYRVSERANIVIALGEIRRICEFAARDLVPANANEVGDTIENMKELKKAYSNATKVFATIEK
jgi:hypothetical protein